jgi:hypothetical protein
MLQLKINAVDSIIAGEGSVSGDDTLFSAGTQIVPLTTTDFLVGTIGAGREIDGDGITESTVVDPGKYLHIRNEGVSSIADTCYIHVFLKGYYLNA